MTASPGDASNALTALLTIEDVAKILAVSPRHVRDLVDDGDIPFIDIGKGNKRRLMRFELKEVQDFINSRRTRLTPTDYAIRPLRKVQPYFPIIDFRALLEKAKADKRSQTEKEKKARLAHNHAISTGKAARQKSDIAPYPNPMAKSRRRKAKPDE